MISPRKLLLFLLVALLPVLGLACKSQPTEPVAVPVKTPVKVPVEPEVIDQAGVPFKKLNFSKLPRDFKVAMAQISASQTWHSRSKDYKKGQAPGVDPSTGLSLKMNPKLLNEVFDMGSAFLVNWQLPEGNFRYMYDWMAGTWVKDDHQVRQAGSLWGVATCYRYRPSADKKEVLDKGLKFWFDRTIEGPKKGTLTMKYPGEARIHSGSVALVALAIIEYLATDAPMDEAYKADLNAKLDGYLGFLQWMQLDNGHISRDFHHKRNKRRTRSSPYYDGE